MMLHATHSRVRMSLLITLDKINIAYGLNPLLHDANLQIKSAERICLIGRNGAGKSTLMKIIEGTVKPDSGNIWRKPHLKISRLTQELPEQNNLSVYEYVASGVEAIGQLLADYHTLTNQVAHNHQAEDIKKLSHIQDLIETHQAWSFDNTIQQILTRLELNPDHLINELSGGWQRRAALAKALVSSPELLLLDEPTNHLDISAIQWLEDQLLNLNIGLLFITHDRALLQRLATRIIELDRGNLSSWSCSYQEYLIRKEELANAEQKHHADFDKKLAEEERWIRQGVKARRTRNEGRVRALEALRQVHAQRIEKQKNPDFKINQGDESGQLVIEAKNISQEYDHKKIIHNFSTRIMRGDKIGLIGPNGSGKTTLLNILTGQLTPQQGEMTLGTKLQIAYFDQLRSALEPNKTVAENVAEGRTAIEINGQTKHIISYLNDFLFTAQRAMTPVKALSGGECNRLLLARLFSQPANLLILDEPTNDLDIETLELLEDLLTHYQGTLLIVSHDRAFLDNVVTSTFIFENDGNIQEYVGGYQDYLSQRKAYSQQIISKSQAGENKTTTTRIKLSYKEQNELAELPGRIEKLEKEHLELQEQISQPEFYKQAGEKITASLSKVKEIEDALSIAYARWDELDNKK